MAIPGMQIANPGGLAKCKKCNQISWLANTDSSENWKIEFFIP
jgi:hypothetical protein